jgi:enterochelin esterase-like enzyme
MITTTPHRPAVRILILAFSLIALSACSSLSLEQEPPPTLYEIPTLTPLPPTDAPQPIGTPTSSVGVTNDVANTPAEIPTALPCDETEGQIIESSYPSAIAQQDVAYRIYLPPCYATSGKRYPILYIMHGLGEGMDYKQWDEMGLDEAADQGYQSGTLSPFIIVMPNGAVFLPNGTVVHGMNYFLPSNSYEFMILTELMPGIEAEYCTWNEAPGRAIGGLSRGGFWAYEITFQHPELFGAVGGHSAYFYESPEIPPTSNPLDLARDAQGIEGLRMYLDHGANDYPEVREAMEVFSARLNARGIEHTYIVNPVGSHSEDYWASHTADYLSFYAAEWPKDVAQLPPC